MDADRSMLADLVLARGTLDRLGHRRADGRWQAARRADPRSRVVRVCRGELLTRSAPTGGIEVALAAAATVTTGDLTFLGVDDADVAYFAEHVADDDLVVRADGEEWTDLRTAGAGLDARDSGLAVTAVALDNWLRAHLRCPRCGTPTEFHAGGWSRRCPEDGSEHFPRTDPAVIMLVRDADDRALLGRQARWPHGVFSTLAGFVEAGESAEAAVRREVQEEAGVRVGRGPEDVRYLGSQPWPFPSSLMLGYHAWAADPTIDVDGDEIAEARWFTRDELAVACAAGDVRLPGSISIARRLVERWFGSSLPGEWSRSIAPPR